MPRYSAIELLPIESKVTTRTTASAAVWDFLVPWVQISIDRDIYIHMGVDMDYDYVGTKSLEALLWELSDHMACGWRMVFVMYVFGDHHILAFLVSRIQYL